MLAGAVLLGTLAHVALPSAHAAGASATAPAAVVAPSSLRFAAETGTTSPVQYATLANAGTAPLNIAAITTGGRDVGSFAITPAGTCREGAALPPGAACNIGVQFSPADAGAHVAALTVATNDAVASSQSVALTGVAVSPASDPPDAPAPPDDDPDGDGVAGTSDSCPAFAGDRLDGCPSELKAIVDATWRVKPRSAQLLSLTVRAPLGSQIALRCRSSTRACGFTTKAIPSTTTRTTNLTRTFRGRRVLPAGTTITVRVTRPLQRGTYQRMTVRGGGRLPTTQIRCLDAQAKVESCPG